VRRSQVSSCTTVTHFSAGHDRIDVLFSNRYHASNLYAMRKDFPQNG
jgi:hypothetical protein